MATWVEVVVEVEIPRGRSELKDEEQAAPQGRGMGRADVRKD